MKGLFSISLSVNLFGAAVVVSRHEGHLGDDRGHELVAHLGEDLRAGLCESAVDHAHADGLAQLGAEGAAPNLSPQKLYTHQAATKL